jgi:hypothetical protein
MAVDDVWTVERNPDTSNKDGKLVIGTGELFDSWALRR